MVSCQEVPSIPVAPVKSIQTGLAIVETAVPVVPIVVPVAPMTVQPPTPTVVYLFIKTTGFGKKAKIIQITARSGSSTFNVYIHPRKKISPKVTRFTGFKLVQNRLFWKDRFIRTMLCKRAFIRFLRFLERFNTVILVGHNALAFHASILLNMVTRLGLLDWFRRVVHGFADSLKLIRSRLPERKLKDQKYTFRELTMDLLGADAGPHNAVVESRMLEDLLRKANYSVEELIGAAMPLAKYEARQSAIQEKRQEARNIQPGAN